MRPSILGLVLAGGLARRMGGGDKARIRIGGKTILERVLARLAPQCGSMILNANGDPARFAALGLPVVPDTIGGFAPKDSSDIRTSRSVTAPGTLPVSRSRSMPHTLTVSVRR